MQELLEQGVRAGVTPGGVLLIADGGAVVERVAFGVTQTDPPGSGHPVQAAVLRAREIPWTPNPGRGSR